MRLTPRALSDEETGHTLRAYLLGLMDKERPRRLVLDFGLVEYVDSMGAGKLVLLHRKLQTLGARLALCRINARLAELFELLRLSLLFSIYPDAEAALQALGTPRPDCPARARFAHADEEPPAEAGAGRSCFEAAKEVESGFVHRLRARRGNAWESR